MENFTATACVPFGESEIHFRETGTLLSHDGAHVVLYAYLGNEQVAALDFTESEGANIINMIFVKPHFRRRGIGSALLHHLIRQYPDAHITCQAVPQH